MRVTNHGTDGWLVAAHRLPRAVNRPSSRGGSTIAQSAKHPEGFSPFPDVPLLDQLPPMSDDEGVALVTPFRLAADQLAAGLDGAELVDRLPEGSAGISFMRYGTGYYGVPFCESPGDGVNCFPVGPGPDDDPFGFTCVCVGPREPKELLGPPPGGDLQLETVIHPACQLTVGPLGRFVCRNRRCLTQCRRVWLHDQIGRFFGAVRAACICQ
jgi:hypothetical protein